MTRITVWDLPMTASAKHRRGDPLSETTLPGADSAALGVALLAHPDDERCAPLVVPPATR